MNTTLENPSVETKKTVTKLGVFSGAFGNFQRAAYTDLKLAGFDAPVAHKIAFDYGSDIGAALAKGDAKLGSKIGKAKADGESRISISGGGVTTTSHAMSILRVVQQVNSMFMEKILAQRDELPTLAKNLREYVETCEQWVGEQQFSE